MLKKLSVILTALCLSACSQNVELSKPAPQKMKVQTVDKKSQKGSATVYLCKGNKEVSVVHTKQKQKSKKTLSQVTVTFNDCQPISPSEYLLDDLRFFVLPIRRLYTISWKLQP